MFLLFFFKQKTAYEMRISDWSSDVCSSDLPRLPRLVSERISPEPTCRERCNVVASQAHLQDLLFPAETVPNQGSFFLFGLDQSLSHSAHLARRSEEHTSELQSLMRISYAVFCLKKKKHYK